LPTLAGIGQGRSVRRRIPCKGCIVSGPLRVIGEDREHTVQTLHLQVGEAACVLIATMIGVNQASHAAIGVPNLFD